MQWTIWRNAISLKVRGFSGPFYNWVIFLNGHCVSVDNHCYSFVDLKAHVHPRRIARPVLQQKTFPVVENRCLQCAKSIFVNLPQFAKSGLKESLNRFFWYFSLHLFGHFGLVSILFVSVSVCFHCSTFDGGAIETYGWKSALTGVSEVHSSRWIRFLNLWRDGKGALGCKFYRQRVCRVPSTSNVQL